MRIGKLRHYISIQDRTETKNEFGEAEYNWNDFAKAYAEIKPVTAKEYFAAQGEVAQVTHRIVMRYKSGVKPKMRILFKDRVFDIKAVRDYFEKNRVLEIMAQEKIDG